MTTFGVQVFDRADSPVLLPSNVSILPTRWSSDAMGGPRSAEIDLSGSVDGMLALANWLGYRINVIAGSELVWWGQVDSVSVTSGGLVREVTLDGVSNRVKVLYSIRLPGGALEGGETDWAEDAESVSRYGARELVHSASGSLSEVQALALRARLLSALSLPQRRLKIGKGKVSGKITARGYWKRLGDIYYAQYAGLEEFISSPVDTVPMGLGMASAFVGFGGQEEVNLINDCDGQFLNFADYAGLKVVVQGSASNNGIRTVESGTKRDAWVYTASTISFDPADDILDSAWGLADLASNEVIFVSGAATGSNNGAKLVKSTGSNHIEISPGWSGGTIATGAAGPAITLRRGNSITVAENVIVERPNGVDVVTITAYGQKMYQTFSLATNLSWTVAQIELRIRKVGNPSDNLRVRLVLDSAGSPGTTLETVTVVPGTGVSGVMEWLLVPFSNTVPISYGTTYGILVDRTGAEDPNNYFEIELASDGGYSRGVLKLHDGTVYQADDRELIFRVLGAQDNALQTQQVILGSGTELVSVLVEDTSGILTIQYQEGDETSEAIALGLLEQGSSTGVRMLATVTSERIVRIFAQAASDSRLLVWRDGEVKLAVGGKVADGWVPVGAWVHIDDLSLVGAWAGLSPVFIERATYQVGSGLTIEAEYQEPLASALRGVKQG